MATDIIETFKMLIPCIKGKWFVGDGGLLGLIREGKLLEWDNDIDIYVLEDTTFDLEGTDLKYEKYYTCSKIYNKHNKKVKVNPWLEYMSVIKLNNQKLNRSEVMVKAAIDYQEKKIIANHTENHIDIFYIKKVGDKYLASNECARPMCPEYFEDNLDIKSNYDLGFKVNIPSKAEDILKRQYGEDWKTPKKDWGYY
jgi:phosphorylcholine metabolism protein LicD